MKKKGMLTQLAPAAGFTLIEILIVVVILGILAAISYPAYQDYVRGARRSDAYISLSTLANDLERFRAECSVYTDDLTADRNCTDKGLGRSDDLSPERNYRLEIILPPVTGAPPAGYLLRASAIAKQAGDGDCQTLTLSSTGAKDATGANTAKCWRK